MSIQREAGNGWPYPSIWLGSFASKAEFDAGAQRLTDACHVFDWLDDRVLFSRHPFKFPGYCAACDGVRPLHLNWHFSGGGAGSIHPAWTETGVCGGCGLNSRMRAVVDLLRKRVDLGAVRRAYVAEQTTPSFRVLSGLLPSLVGSEYLGPQYESGQIVQPDDSKEAIRHEDLTALSYETGHFDLVVTQDVFEHIPDYRKAFAELSRVLSPNGLMVFTIPFFSEREETQIRAVLEPDGVRHNLPPEIHGNPVSAEGSLCFQNFGWDILDDLRSQGFAEARAFLYWGPWQGHLGAPFFVFEARKR